MSRILKKRKVLSKPKKQGYPKIPNSVGQHIRKRRMDLGLLQKDLARKWGVSEDTITGWENGRSDPQIPFFPTIILFLEFNPMERKNNTLAEHIYAYRCANGLSCKRLGKLLAVDASTVRAWELEKRLPNIKMLMLMNKY